MNLDPKSVKIFRRLTKQSPSTIKRIRKIWLEDQSCFFILDWYDGEKLENKIRNKAKRLSDNYLINYFITSYDADFGILPKKLLKTLTKKEREYIIYGTYRSQISRNW